MRGQEHVVEVAAWQGREEGRCNVYIYILRMRGKEGVIASCYTMLCFNGKIGNFGRSR